MIHKSETLRDELRNVIHEDRFGDMTAAETIGVLELLKFELVESIPVTPEDRNG